MAENRVSEPWVGPVFEAAGNRVQQPGTTVRDPAMQPERIQREKEIPKVPVKSQASDKFAVIAFAVDQSVARQLLPVDPYRKSARIQCFSAAHGIFIGTQDAIGNLISNGGGDAAGIPNALTPNCWYIPPNNFAISAYLPPFEYTSKQSLFVCSGLAATFVALQCIVERYDSGTPVN